MAILLRVEDEGRKAVRARDFGRRVRELRDGASLSQEGLAEEAGLNRATIIEIEKGRAANPRPSTRRKLARALEVDVRDLWTP